MDITREGTADYYPFRRSLREEARAASSEDRVEA